MLGIKRKSPRPPPFQSPIDAAQNPTEDDCRFLDALDGEIWEEHQAEMRANMTGHAWIQSYRTVKRSLTQEEMDRFFAMLKRVEPCCIPENTAFGFGIGIRVYEHAKAVGLPPEPLFLLSDKHLSFLPDETPQDRKKRFWALITPFTHSQKNRTHLDFYGIKLEEDMAAYDY